MATPRTTSGALRHLSPRCPRSVARPVRGQILLPRPQQRQRPYYTPASPPPSPFSPTEAALLASAYARVPAHGFTHAALVLGATDLGYVPAGTTLAAGGAFDLVRYHLVTARLALRDDDAAATAQSAASAVPARLRALLLARLRALLLARLRANEPVRAHLAGALGLMSLPEHVPAALAELGRLADDVLYLAGDVAVDSSWYARRAGVAGVYAATELFMTQEADAASTETERFLDRRLEGLRTLSDGADAVGQWVGFTAVAAVNVARSFGLRV